MFRRVKPLLLITLSLILAGLACRLGGRSRVELGEQIQSDLGGFTLQTIPDYEIEEVFGMVYMIAADADPDFGPFIMAAGELHDEDISPQQLLDQMQGETEDIEFGDIKQNRVDGIDGLLVEFSGEEGGRTVKGKVFVATPRPYQEFYIAGMAPEDQWKDFEPYFDAVLASVSFMDAQPYEWDDFDDWDNDWDDDDWDDFEDGDDVSLGAVIQSEEGGFMLQAIPDFEVEEIFNMVYMIASDADPDFGPLIMASGEVHGEDINPQQILDRMEEESDGIVFGAVQQTRVDGIDGLLVEFTGQEDGRIGNGKVFVATPRPRQEFYIVGFAPEDQWKDFEPMFDAVLASVSFMDAQPFDWGFDDWDDDEPVETVQEIRQWAVAAEASSEYSSDGWSAMQATGAPDVDTCSDDPRAWASRYDNSVDDLVLFYETPVNPTELTIYQTYNPTQVVEILFIDIDGQARILWEGEPEALLHCPDVWTHTIELDEIFYTDTVVIRIDQSVLGIGWAEIDAVELVGYPVGGTGSTGQTPTDGLPVEYHGLMAGPIYQSWLDIVVGQTRLEDLDRIMPIPKELFIPEWEPAADVAYMFTYEMPWPDMIGYVQINSDDLVIRKYFSIHDPTDFELESVNQTNFDAIREHFMDQNPVSYEEIANYLGSGGFLVDESLLGTGQAQQIGSIYYWYGTDGKLIEGEFFNGLMYSVWDLLNYREP